MAVADAGAYSGRAGVGPHADTQVTKHMRRRLANRPRNVSADSRALTLALVPVPPTKVQTAIQGTGVQVTWTDTVNTTRRATRWSARWGRASMHAEPAAGTRRPQLRGYDARGRGDQLLRRLIPGPQRGQVA